MAEITPMCVFIKEIFLRTGEAMNNREAFQAELRELINRKSMEGDFGNTPDFVLAGYLMSCLDAFTNAAGGRDVHRPPQTLDQLTLRSAQRPEYPCIESTFDCVVGNLELRM